jgi:hypothetical protein
VSCRRPHRPTKAARFFWLPGQFASFAATPADSGWSMPMVYYHTSADAGGARNFVGGGNLALGIEVSADLLLLAPT